MRESSCATVVGWCFELVIEEGCARSPGEGSRGGSVGDHLVQARTLAKTGLAPAVEDSVNQVIRDGMVLGDMLVALFALPRAFKNACYLFEYSGHYVCFAVTSLPAPFNKSVKLTEQLSAC